MEISKIKSFQLYRNATPVADRATAISTLKGLVGTDTNLTDGQPLACRYYYTEGEGDSAHTYIKAVYAIYNAANATATTPYEASMTIIDADSDVIPDVIQDAIDKIEGDITNINTAITNINSAITDIQGDITTIEGNITNIQNKVDEISGKVDSNTATIENIKTGAGLEDNGSYSANTGTTNISGATSLKDADEKLDAAIESIKGGVGLNEDGSYTAPDGNHYLTDSDSVKDSISKLDTQVYNNTTSITSLSETVEKNRVVAADTSVTVVAPTDDNGLANTTVAVKLRGTDNALALGDEGLYVDQSALTSYEGVDAIAINDKADTTGVKVVSLTLNANESVLSQDANGLLSTLSLVKIDQAEGSTFASQYKLVGKDGTTALGATIDIAKDQFLKSAEFIASATDADHDADNNVVVGDPYLKFVFSITDGSEQITYVAVKSLVDVYTAGDGINVNGNVVSIKLDGTSESFLTVDADGIKVTGVTEAINNAVTAATATIGAYTVNGKAISSNPTLGGADIALTDYQKSDFAVDASTDLAASDTINGAFDKIENRFEDDEFVTSMALTEIKETIGFEENATYVPNTGSTYISAVTSLNAADVALDAAIKTVDGRVDAAVADAISVAAGQGIAIADNADKATEKIISIKLPTDSALSFDTDGALLFNGIIDCGTY